MIGRTIGRFFVALLTVLTISWSVGAYLPRTAWATYTPVELALPSGYSSGSAMAINNFAETSSSLLIVGFVADSSNQTVPCYWARSGTGFVHGFLPVGATNGQGKALAVNASGDIVGWTYFSGSGEQHACLWKKSGTSYSLRDLGRISGTNTSVAYGINNNGDIVGDCINYGYGSPAYPTRGFFLSAANTSSIGTTSPPVNSSMIEPPSYNGGASDQTYARAINNNGVIGGGSIRNSTGNLGATMWKVDTSTTPPTFTTYVAPRSAAILTLTDADIPTVKGAGYANQSPDPNAPVPYGASIYWSPSASFNIVNGYSKEGYATGINNNSRSVGSHRGNVYPFIGWYSDDDGVTKTRLVDPIPADPGESRSIQVYGINDYNLIAGFIGSSPAYWKP